MSFFECGFQFEYLQINNKNCLFTIGTYFMGGIDFGQKLSNDKNLL